MKAPDKIYLQNGLRCGEIVPNETWSKEEVKGYENVEYINKKLLLDWLEEALENAEVMPATTPMFRGAKIAAVTSICQIMEYIKEL